MKYLIGALWNRPRDTRDQHFVIPYISNFLILKIYPLSLGLHQESVFNWTRFKGSEISKAKEGQIRVSESLAKSVLVQPIEMLSLDYSSGKTYQRELISFVY